MCWIKCERERDSSPEPAPRIAAMYTQDSPRVVLVSSHSHSLHSRRSSHHSPRPSRPHSRRSHHSLQVVTPSKDEYRILPFPNPRTSDEYHRQPFPAPRRSNEFRIQPLPPSRPSDEYRIQPQPNPRTSDEIRIQPFSYPLQPKPSEYVPGPLPLDPLDPLPSQPLPPLSTPLIVQPAKLSVTHPRRSGDRVSVLVFDETGATQSRQSSIQGRRHSSHNQSNPEEVVMLRTSVERRRSTNRSRSRGRSSSTNQIRTGSHVRTSTGHNSSESRLARQYLSPSGSAAGTRDASRDPKAKVVIVDENRAGRRVSIDGRASGNLQVGGLDERRASITFIERGGARDRSRTRVIFEDADGTRVERKQR